MSFHFISCHFISTHFNSFPSDCPFVCSSVRVCVRLSVRLSVRPSSHVSSRPVRPVSSCSVPSCPVPSFPSCPKVQVAALCLGCSCLQVRISVSIHFVMGLLYTASILFYPFCDTVRLPHVSHLIRMGTRCSFRNSAECNCGNISSC